MDPKVTQDDFGWRIWQGEVAAMPGPHQHAEIEFNLVQRGELSYLFGGERVTVRAGHWLLFWGAFPHTLTAVTPGARCLWITLPLDAFLRLNLQGALGARLLHGDVLGERQPGDAALFTRWQQDVRAGGPERERIVALELEARLRRLALDLPPQGTRQGGAADEGAAQRLARLIGERAREPLTLPEIAGAAGLHVNYAATLFRRSFGMTMTAYLTQHRLAHARRLLVTTRRPVLEVAFDSGFGSASAFYAAFTRATGQTPRAYRKARGVGEGKSPGTSRPSPGEGESAGEG